MDHRRHLKEGGKTAAIVFLHWRISAECLVLLQLCGYHLSSGHLVVERQQMGLSIPSQNSSFTFSDSWPGARFIPWRSASFSWRLSLLWKLLEGIRRPVWVLVHPYDSHLLSRLPVHLSSSWPPGDLRAPAAVTDAMTFHWLFNQIPQLHKWNSGKSYQLCFSDQTLTETRGLMIWWPFHILLYSETESTMMRLLHNWDPGG